MRRLTHAGHWCESQKKRDYYEVHYVDRRIILKRILDKLDGWYGLN
jgi:hypothetical protein